MSRGACLVRMRDRYSMRSRLMSRKVIQRQKLIPVKLAATARSFFSCSLATGPSVCPGRQSERSSCCTPSKLQVSPSLFQQLPKTSLFHPCDV